MTLSESLPIIFAILGGIALAAAYIAYIKAQVFRLRRYEHWADKFFAAAKPLVANSETPDDVIDLIDSLNGLIVDRNAPFGIYNVFLKKLEQNNNNRSRVSEPDEKFSNFLKKNSDLVTNIECIVHAGLMACAYTSLISGTQARAVLADVFSEMNTKNFAIEGVRAVTERVHRSSGLVPLFSRR